MIKKREHDHYHDIKKGPKQAQISEFSKTEKQKKKANHMKIYRK